LLFSIGFCPKINVITSRWQVAWW